MMASEARTSLEEPTRLKAFSSQHGLPAQRYYNLLCMAYGSNPKMFEKMVSLGRLPKERADGCAEEYAMLRFAFGRLIMPYIDQTMQRDGLNQVQFAWGPAIPSTDGLDAPPLVEAPYTRYHYVD